MSRFLAVLSVAVALMAPTAVAAIPAPGVPLAQFMTGPIPKLATRKAQRPVQFAQRAGVRVSRSMALRLAMAASPGSQGLGVRFVPRRHGYIVKLKTGNRIHRVFVDAYSGAVRR